MSFSFCQTVFVMDSFSFALYPVQYHVHAMIYAGGSSLAFAFICYSNPRTIYLLYIKASGLQFMLLSVISSY